MVRPEQRPLLVAGLGLIALSFVLPAPPSLFQLISLGVVLGVGVLVLLTDRRVRYPNWLLWWLVLWGGLHIVGSATVGSDGQVLYRQVLIPLIGEPYLVFKYDQLVHAVGFGVGTLFVYHFLAPSLAAAVRGWRLWFVVVMAGLGLGAINEIVEFVLSTSLNIDLGRYENSMIDLIADLLGAVVAATVSVRLRSQRAG